MVLDDIKYKYYVVKLSTNAVVSFKIIGEDLSYGRAIMKHIQQAVEELHIPLEEVAANIEDMFWIKLEITW